MNKFQLYDEWRSSHNPVLLPEWLSREFWIKPYSTEQRIVKKQVKDLMLLFPYGMVCQDKKRREFVTRDLGFGVYKLTLSLPSTVKEL